MELFLIDATGPFFRNYDRKRVNWSKIPFTHLDSATDDDWITMGIRLNTTAAICVFRLGLAREAGLPTGDIEHMRDFCQLLLRRQRGYRFIDRFFTLYLMGIACRTFKPRDPKAVPKFLRKSAMGVETLLK